MLPESLINDMMVALSDAIDGRHAVTREEMTQALEWGLKRVCACGNPLMLGMVHHYNLPCEVPK